MNVFVQSCVSCVATLLVSGRRNRSLVVMIAALLASAGLGTGQITVSNETAPPSGSAQFKIWPPGTAAPTHLVLDFDPAVVGSVQGIGAFNANGDIYGAATVNGTHVDARLSTGVVQIRELPLLTATEKLRPGVAPGTRSTLKVASVDNDGATVT